MNWCFQQNCLKSFWVIKYALKWQVTHFSVKFAASVFMFYFIVVGTCELISRNWLKVTIQICLQQKTNFSTSVSIVSRFPAILTDRTIWESVKYSIVPVTVCLWYEKNRFCGTFVEVFNWTLKIAFVFSQLSR